MKQNDEAPPGVLQRLLGTIIKPNTNATTMIKEKEEKRETTNTSNAHSATSRTPENAGAKSLESWWERVHHKYLSPLEQLTQSSASPTTITAGATPPGILHRSLAGIKIAFFAVGPYTLYTAWQIRKYGTTNTLEQTLFGVAGGGSSTNAFIGSSHGSKSLKASIEEAGKVVVQRRLLPLLFVGGLFFPSEYFVRRTLGKTKTILERRREKKSGCFSIESVFSESHQTSNTTGFLLDPWQAPVNSPFSISAKAYLDKLANSSKLCRLQLIPRIGHTDYFDVCSHYESVRPTERFRQFLMECYIESTLDPTTVYWLYVKDGQFTHQCLQSCLRKQRALITRDVYKLLDKTYANQLQTSTEQATNKLMSHVLLRMDQKLGEKLSELVSKRKLPHSQQLFLSKTTWKPLPSKTETRPTKPSRILGGVLTALALAVPYRRRLQTALLSPQLKGVNLPHGFFLRNPAIPAVLVGALMGIILPSYEMIA